MNNNDLKSLYRLANTIVRGAVGVIDKEDWVDTRYQNNVPRWLPIIPVLQVFLGILVTIELTQYFNASFHWHITDGKSAASMVDLWTWTCMRTVFLSPKATSISPAILPILAPGIVGIIAVLAAFMWSRIQRRYVKIKEENVEAVQLSAFKKMILTIGNALKTSILLVLVYFPSMTLAFIIINEIELDKIPRQQCPSVYWLVPLSNLILALGSALFINFGVYAWRTGSYVRLYSMTGRPSAWLYPKITKKALVYLATTSVIFSLMPMDWLPKHMQTPSHILFHRLFFLAMPLTAISIYTLIVMAISRLSFYYLPLARKILSPSTEFEIEVIDEVTAYTEQQINCALANNHNVCDQLLKTIEDQIGQHYPPLYILRAVVFLILAPAIVLPLILTAELAQLIRMLTRFLFLELFFAIPWILHTFKRRRRLSLVAASIRELAFKLSVQHASPEDLELLEALKALLPSEFDELILVLGIPRSELPAESSPQASRAISLIQYAKQRSDVLKIQQLLISRFGLAVPMQTLKS